MLVSEQSCTKFSTLLHLETCLDPAIYSQQERKHRHTTKYKQSGREWNQICTNSNDIHNTWIHNV